MQLDQQKKTLAYLLPWNTSILKEQEAIFCYVTKMLLQTSFYEKNQFAD